MRKTLFKCHIRLKQLHSHIYVPSNNDAIERTFTNGLDHEVIGYFRGIGAFEEEAAEVIWRVADYFKHR